ncbi:LysR family transcriptional regulator [Parahaliea maris]|nr:LysR family transcriptional regulator [Parahaliea maris]
MDCLRSFVSIVELGSYTLAAERLGRTQPAISQHIRKLEELVGDKLILRDSARLELTGAGKRLLQYSLRIIELNDQAISEFINPSVSGKLRLGIPSEFAVVLMPRILGQFSAAYPQVALDVQCVLSKDLLQDPSRYDLILALQEWPNSQQPGYLKTESLVWVGSDDFDMRQYDEVPLVAAPVPCIYRARAEQVLTENHINARVVYTIPDLTGIEAAVEAGLGVTVLARSTVPTKLRVLESSRQLPDLGSVGINLITPHAPASTAVSLLAETIADYLVTH